MRRLFVHARVSRRPKLANPGCWRRDETLLLVKPQRVEQLDRQEAQRRLVVRERQDETV